MHANSKLICSAWRLREMLLQELLVLEFPRIESSIHLSANRTHQRFKGATTGEMVKGSEPPQHFDCPIVDRIFIDPTPHCNCGQSSCLYEMFFYIFIESNSRLFQDFLFNYAPQSYPRVGWTRGSGRVGSDRVGSRFCRILPVGSGQHLEF